jgi:hypothetical protein
MAFLDHLVPAVFAFIPMINTPSLNFVAINLLGFVCAFGITQFLYEKLSVAVTLSKLHAI